MKSRYCYNPMATRKIGRRVTLMDRLHRAMAKRRQAQPDVFEIIGYCAPVYPGK